MKVPGLRMSILTLFTSVNLISVLLLITLFINMDYLWPEAFKNHTQDSTKHRFKYTKDSTQDHFKALNKRLDSLQSLLGSLRDQFTTLKIEQHTQAGVGSGNAILQYSCDFGRTVLGKWDLSDTTHTWEWSNGCCKPYVTPEKRTSCLLRFPKLVFLGDSQMAMLFRVIHRSLSSFSCVQIKSGGRCGNLGDYYHIEELIHGDYQKPNVSRLEGPLAYGLANPGCSDCSGCDSLLYKCVSKDGDTIELEYLAMEFIRDVELQSVLSRTSQENIMHYLAQSDSINKSVFVLNAGLHDLLILDVLAGGGEITWFSLLESATEIEFSSLPNVVDMYEANVLWLLSLFKRYNVSKATFMATSALKQPHPRTNMLIKAINQRAFSAMASAGYSYLDTFPMLDSQEAQFLYEDIMHAGNGGGIYYETVQDLLLRSLCSTN